MRISDWSSDVCSSDLHGAFTTFWDDMLRRPQDVLNNLKNFALSVVRTLQEMASKVLANQIFNSLLSIGASLIGGAPPGNAGGMDLRGFPLFNGGLVGRAEGGLVTEGENGRAAGWERGCKYGYICVVAGS